MKPKNKYFAVADVHGHLTILKQELDKAGFKLEDETHKLIVVGDMFDRGPESYDLYLWLKDLCDKDKAIVLRGNHEEFIEKVLDKTEDGFNFRYNGVNTTMDDFYHQTRSFEMYLMINNLQWNQSSFNSYRDEVVDSINQELPELREWLESLPDYYETDNYIFTHGIIFPRQDYKNTTKFEWKKENHWAKPEDFAGGFENTTGKHLVVGHLDSECIKRALAKTRFSLEYVQKEAYGTLYIPIMDTFFIDTCTILTQKINVLVIEDEEV